MIYFSKGCFINDDNYEIEDLLSNFNKKKEKKKNTSKKKGNRGENELADILKERFDKKFFRVTGSGNRWSQVDLSEETKGVFTGDIVCPSNFRFILECKYGYSDIELCGIFTSGHKLIDEWMVKAQRDADFLGKHPIICWRKPHYEWLVLSPTQPKIDWLCEKLKTVNKMIYNGPNSVQWTIVPLNAVLSRDIEDAFWFK